MARGAWHEEADLLIVGASIGGLAAAVMVADRGGRAIVVERGKDLGGGAGAEAESIAAAGSRFQRAAGIDDAPSTLADDILAAARHHIEPDVVSALAAQGGPIVAWIADRCGSGVEVLAGLRAPGHSAPRIHSVGAKGGAGLVADLARAVGRHTHVSVRTGAAVDRLVRDEGGAVRGVTVRGDRRGAPHALGGRVLLACGGFVSDDTLVGTHAPALASLPYQGAGRADGEGLRLGLEVGASTRHMSGGIVTPFLAMPSAVAVTVPLVELGAVLVNQAGRRFADETGESLTLACAVRSQPGRMAYLLFDERIAAEARAADPYFAHVVLPRSGRRAATLPDLAKQFELDASGLALTIDTFNANLELGGDPFGRERFGGPLNPPFHAIRVTGARRQTLGGLAVDASARVLDGAGCPVWGLYAAGGAAVGLGGDGTEGALAGTDALTALGLARLAALDVLAAAEPPSAD
jgi:succinate dehydrogenase/fumarate reductase flavoprotein subunit